jgi:hypothetical protein
MRKEANTAAFIGLGALAAAGLGYGLYRQRQAAQAAKAGVSLRRMPLRDVESSMIRQVGYDPKREALVVRFNTGKKYAYNDVPASQYEQLLRAESVGKHFNERIRDRYDHEKVSFLRLFSRLKPPTPKVTPPAASVVGDAVPPPPSASAVEGAAAPTPTTTATQPTATTPQPPPPQPTTTAQPPTPPAQAAEGPGFLARNILPIGAGVAGAGIGAVMKDSDGNRMGMGGAIAGAMTGIGVGALSKSILTSPVAAANKLKPEPVKTGSLLTSTLATGVGAGVGAFTAGEGNRLQGALIGGGTGLLLGQAARVLPSHTGSLADATTGKLTPVMQAKIKAQEAALQAQLKNTKGVFERNRVVEGFMKSPVNAEYAQVYRSQQRGQLMGSVVGGGIGGLAVSNGIDPTQQKQAALRAVARFRG